ncbi:prolipoprotein diacylglyceryl transferase [Hugonella massiliensis]|uniref:prolipoprotein diacylglyceryl transferase n=1 Tax=Hugonella massiliensis TaxID=1720315 RepID=UPI0009E77E02|nr:prolipoprotein diacylglyceryl transferase [Hugonella massiliensis]
MLNEIYHSLDPVAFTLGPLTVRWYGIAYILGFIFAAIVIVGVSKRWKIRVTDDDLMTILLCVIVGVIVGARLGYCLFYGDGYYLAHPADILALQQGGMSFHGGLVGALLSGLVAARITGIPYGTLADMGCIAAPIGLFFGRCANFINGELWGAVTDAPWGVVFGGAAGTMPRQPSQLFEALLEGVVIFVVLFTLSRKYPPRPRGTFLGIFLVMYGAFRFLIEFVRQPDVQLGYLFGTDWVTMGQVLSVPLIVVGACVLAWMAKTKLPQTGSPLPPDESTGSHLSDSRAREGGSADGADDGDGAGPSAKK